MSTSSFLYETNENYAAATNAAIARNRVKGNLARFSDQKVVQFLEANKHNSFYGSLYSNLGKYGKLSEKQLSCVYKAIDKKEADKAAKEAEKDAFKAKVAGLTHHHLVVVKRSKGIAQLSDRRYHNPTILCTVESNTLVAGDYLDVWANDDFSKVVHKDTFTRLGNYDYYTVKLVK